MLITKLDDDRFEKDEMDITTMFLSLRASLSREAALLAERDALRKRAEEAERYAERLRGACSGTRDLDYVILLEKAVKKAEADLAAIRERNEKLEKVAEAGRNLRFWDIDGYGPCFCNERAAIPNNVHPQECRAMNAALRSLEGK